METIGLGGDGDEVDSIVAVETCFGISLDREKASGWVTAGDLFESVLRALPSDQGQGDERWPHFARTLCEGTGTDPSRVGPDTLLLALPLRTVAARWFNRKLGRPEAGRS